MQPLGFNCPHPTGTTVINHPFMMGMAAYGLPAGKLYHPIGRCFFADRKYLHRLSGWMENIITCSQIAVPFPTIRRKHGHLISNLLAMSWRHKNHQAEQFAPLYGF